MTGYIGCLVRRILVLSTVGFLGMVSFAQGQTRTDDAAQNNDIQSLDIDRRELRATLTDLLRSTSELAQAAVLLSNQVDAPSDNKENRWLPLVVNSAEAFRIKLEENGSHLVSLESALGRPHAGSPLLGEWTRDDLPASNDEGVQALAEANRMIEIETRARSVETERRRAAESEAAALTEKIASAQKRLIQLQAAHEELRGQSDEVESELDETRRKLESVENDYVVLESGFQNCRQGIEDCRLEKATLDPDDLSGKLEMAEGQLAQLLATRDALSSQVEDATSTAEQCAAILTRSDDRLSPALTEIERLEAALAAEQRKNEALAAEIAAMR